eukprot:scaffold40885_cov36-Cyclotella_meneghiniana.AAC.2
MGHYVLSCRDNKTTCLQIRHVSKDERIQTQFWRRRDKDIYNLDSIIIMPPPATQEPGCGDGC